MSMGLASFVAGMGSGYMAAKSREEDRAQRQQEIDMRKQEHDAKMGDIEEGKKLKLSLANAAKPAEVEMGANGMVKPDYMDNSDVGQSGTADLPNGGLMQGGFKVQGKAYGSLADAQKTADAYNAEDATAKRVGLAYAQAGKPLDAMQYKASARQDKAAEMQMADMVWKKKMGAALQTGSHDALAELVTNSEFGPMAGKKLKAAPTPDGKSVVYSTIDQEGKETPVPALTFSNDRDGLIRAAYMLDQSVSPEHRIEGMRKDQEASQRTAVVEESARHNKAAEAAQMEMIKNTDAHNRAMEANSSAMTGIHAQTLKFNMDKAKLDDPTFNLPPAVKMQAQGLQQRVKSAYEQFAKAAAADPNFDENSKGAQALRGQIASSQLELKTLVGKYIPGGEAPTADPFGLRSKATPQPPTAQPGPANMQPLPVQQAPVSGGLASGLSDWAKSNRANAQPSPFASGSFR
jgi:hypothetical protein